MRVFAMLLLCAPLGAQTLQVVPSTSAPGGTSSLLVTLNSPAGKEPVGLQWRLVLPPEVTAAVENIVVGNAASATEKTVTCAAIKSESAGQSYKCILIGGVRPIANGTIFQVKYQMQSGTKPQTLTIHVSDAVAVWQQGTFIQQVTIPPVDGTITVR